METVTQHYTIDLSSNNNFVQVPAMQGDGNETRYIEIELIENGTQYVVDSDSVTVTIAGTKPDDTEIWNLCEITDDGYILVEITYQMTTVVGRSIYSVILFSTSSNDQLKSFPFYLIVTQSSFDPSYIISTNEFEALAQYTSAAEEAAEAAAESAADAALAGTIGIFAIDEDDGHLYFTQVDSWSGTFSIEDDTNLQVVYDA